MTLGESLRDLFVDQLYGGLYDQLRAHLFVDRIRRQTGGTLGSPIGVPLYLPLHGPLHLKLSGQLGAQLGHQLASRIHGMGLK